MNHSPAYTSDVPRPHGPCPFRVGDRVRIRPESIDQWCTYPVAKDRWRRQLGTVADMGWPTGRGGRLYVTWDGNKSPSYCAPSVLELIGDEWGGVEPMTTG